MKKKDKSKETDKLELELKSKLKEDENVKWYLKLEAEKIVTEEEAIRAFIVLIRQKIKNQVGDSITLYLKEIIEIVYQNVIKNEGYGEAYKKAKENFSDIVCAILEIKAGISSSLVKDAEKIFTKMERGDETYTLYLNENINFDLASATYCLDINHFKNKTFKMQESNTEKIEMEILDYTDGADIHGN